MTQFRLDVSRETGAATLWMEAEETACGYKPVLACPSMDAVRDFALMLLEIDHHRGEESHNPCSNVQAS
jgi:hypothetical protein